MPKSVNELILAHHIPSAYLDVLYSNAFFEFAITRLTFYSYKSSSTDHFLNPCEDFVMLEDLTFELTNIYFNLKKCDSLKKLYILNANYFTGYDVSTYFIVEFHS